MFEVVWWNMENQRILSLGYLEEVQTFPSFLLIWYDLMMFRSKFCHLIMSNAFVIKTAHPVELQNEN